MTEHRPDPEVLLARAKEEEARKSQGRLKLFFGAGQPLGEVEEDASHAGVSPEDGHQHRPVSPTNIHHGSHAGEVINGSEGP